MNNKIANHPVIILAGLSIVIGLAGCDKLASLTEYFSPKPKIAAPTAASVDKSTNKSTFLSTPTAANAAPAADVLAQVGGWSITLPEFQERLTALKQVLPNYDVNDVASNKLILEELVRQQLLVDEAEKSGLAKDKDVVMAVEEFRRTLLVRELASKIAKDITATPQEAEEYYNQNKQEFVSPGTWRLREIVVETEDAAKEILTELLKDADFAEMAKQRSKGRTAAEGGDVGEVSLFPFPQMESAVMSLDIGGVSGVIRGPDGFYIVKVEDKKGGEQMEFEKITQDIVNGLSMMKQQQAIMKHLDELRAQVPVFVNEKLLEGK